MKYKRAFIQGFAGSGKTHLLNKFAELKRAQGKSVRTCAFTHAAADLVIDGITAYSLTGLGFKERVNEKKVKDLMNVDCILVDEASMIPQVVYKILANLPSRIELFIFGDFRQHPPIEKYKSCKLYMDTTMFKSLCGYTKLKMKKQCRQNAEVAQKCVEFFEHAQQFGARNSIDKLPTEIKRVDAMDNTTMMHLCRTNKKRREVNSKCMERECKSLSPYVDRVLMNHTNEQSEYCEEEFDAKAMFYICMNADRYKEQITSSRSATPDECVNLARKYLACSTIDSNGVGHRRVEYTRSPFCMRWQPKHALGMAMVTRPIRHSVLDGRYVDIDCVNCHPVILHHMCKMMHLNVPRLEQYVTDRSGVISKLAEQYANTTLKVDKDTVKTTILMMINGGTRAYRELNGDGNKWLREYRAELDDIVYPAFQRKYSDKVDAHIAYRRMTDAKKGIKPRVASDLGAFVNTFMLAMEAKILDVIIGIMRKYHLLGANGKHVVLSADGLMVPSNPIFNTRDILDECEELIRDKFDGLDMKLLYKPMKPLDIPMYDLKMPEFDDSWLQYIDNEQFDEFERLYVGMPVICEIGYKGVNRNEKFTIMQLGRRGDIKITDDGRKKKKSKKILDPEEKFITLRANVVKNDVIAISLPLVSFRKKFRPAYCTTTHKAQGADLHVPYMIHEIESMDEHGAYVAVTRADASLISIITEPTNAPVKNQAFLDYMKELYENDKKETIVSVDDDSDSGGLDDDEMDALMAEREYERSFE